MTTTKARDPRMPFTQIESSFLAPRDPVLGYIKIGGKDPRVRYARNTGRPWVAPQRYVDPPRFEVTTREKRIQQVEGQGKAKGEKFTVDLGYVRDEAFHKAIGAPAPTALRVRLLYPEWQQNLISFLGAHSGKQWACRGNGVTAVDVVRGEVPCPCPRLKQFEGAYEGPDPKDKLPCKPHGQLNVLLEDAEVFGGFWAFKTTSFESISNLGKALQTFQEMFGRVDGLPLELRVMAATKSYGEGTTTQPIVTLVLPASMNSARQIASDAAAESRRYLPAGSDEEFEAYQEAVVAEMEAETESYAGEFIPETQDPDSDASSESNPMYEIVSDDDGAEESEGPLQEPRDEEKDSPAELPEDTAELLEKLCRAAMEQTGEWDPQAIADRIAFHRERGDLDGLADRLKRHHAAAWEAVNEPGFFDGADEDDEPSDGLAS